MSKPNSRFQIPNSPEPLRVAIVCDWLTGTGGAERVVLELHKMFPEAPIYTSQYDPNPATWYGGSWFKNADIRTGWLQKLPKGLKKFLPIARIWYFSRLKLKDYDLVISSSGAEAKGTRVRMRQNFKFQILNSKPPLHIAYIHAPTHYYWSRYDSYLKNPGFGRLDWLARLGLKLLVGPLRKWDYRAAQGPDYLITNSTHTQKEIKKYYGRDSVVIHPPVNVERFQDSRFQIPNSKQRSSFVIVGRQTPYKRIDLAVAACTQLDLPLTVIGSGPDHQKLRQIAGTSVTFITNASDQQVAQHIAAARAFIFPGVDDFGIVAVEALAAGTPVIAYQVGGALDYVSPGINGEFFTEQTADSLAAVLKNFDPAKYPAKEVQKSAQQFSPTVFQSKFRGLVSEISNQNQT